MRKKLKYFLTLLWFSYLIVTSILLFTKGFLLTRQVQAKNATCTSFDTPLTTEDQYCFRSNQKVILLMVDALRYDFTLFDESNLQPLPYENKLAVIKDTMARYPGNTRLYKFIADPPTTTMQRLKALTTGSLPTFIDAGANFATSEINEDNLIDQLMKQKDNKIVFMGDDTWASLYPNRFARNYPYPSFDVWDLDTVDNGVRSKLFSEIGNKDWKLLIGHFLGVDHCGHRYGPNHVEMVRKLTEIDGVIRSVIDLMDNETILFVLGDHGMTATGDHGGESMDEIQAALFVHSKTPLLSLGPPKKVVKQVDLVPTLAAILGIPIPFQNLGILIHSALPQLETSNRWQLPLFWLWSNTLQTINYIRSYAETTPHTFDPDYLNLYYNEFNELKEQIKGVNSEQGFIQFSNKVEEFLMKIRLLCEEVWIQFEAFSISNGLTFLFLSVFFMFIICDGIPLKKLPVAIEGSFVDVCCISLGFTIILVAVLDFSEMVEVSFFYSSTFITNVLSHLMFLLPVFQNWDLISFNWYFKGRSIVQLICRSILICNICTVFSNSFINEEASVLLFLLVTVLIVTLFSLSSFIKADASGKQKGVACISTNGFLKVLIAGLIVLSLLRTTMYFWRCRVEQEWCFNDIGKQKTPASKLQWCLTVVSLSVTVSFIKMWLRKCGNINGYSITEVCNKLIPNGIIVCTAGFWVLQKIGGNNASVARTSTYLALAVYILTFVALAVLLCMPICVSVISQEQQQASATVNIFQKLRGHQEGAVPIVCGLGTAYSAVFVAIAMYIALLLALILGDLFGFTMVVMVVVGAFFLYATSVVRIKRAETVDDLLNVPTEVVLGWMLLAQYFFYASGHQPAFSNIAWESAFVGTSNLFSHNYILGFLILLNTFGSYFISGLLLPLLIISPFTLLIITPSVYNKQKELAAVGCRGELLLFERDRAAMAALFSLSCKYIAGHSLKVFTSMLAATIHCRHLMVWNVFAPKFIFEAVSLFVTISAVLVGYLVFLRVNAQVQKLVVKLNKIN